MTRWIRFAAAAYAGIGVLAWIFALLWGAGSPLTISGAWLPLSSQGSHVYSGLFGVAFGALVVVVTRVLVAHFGWARRLHSELRPVASSMSVPVIWILAALSAFGEELFFRGLLQPFLGVILQALVFGLVHQMPGPSRWVWAAWASIMGLMLGAMFQLTGSLLGPLVAHALINGFNLQYLREHDPQPPRRSLGGLLGDKALGSSPRT